LVRYIISPEVYDLKERRVIVFAVVFEESCNFLVTRFFLEKFKKGEAVVKFSRATVYSVALSFKSFLDNKGRLGRMPMDSLTGFFAAGMTIIAPS
jgi:hypothetical protein